MREPQPSLIKLTRSRKGSLVLQWRDDDSGEWQKLIRGLAETQVIQVLHLSVFHAAHYFAPPVYSQSRIVTMSSFNFKLSLIVSACLHGLLVSSMVSNGRPAHGLIGYGISMYKPLCALTCRDVLSTSILTCSEPMDMSDMGMDMGSDTSLECYATDDAFLDTLAYCLSTHCQDVTVWELEKYWNRNVVGNQRNQPIPKATYQQTVAKMTTKPTDTLVIGEALNKTMIVSHEDYEASYNAQGVFEKMEDNHEKYGCLSA